MTPDSETRWLSGVCCTPFVVHLLGNKVCYLNKKPGRLAKTYFLQRPLGFYCKDLAHCAQKSFLTHANCKYSGGKWLIFVEINFQLLQVHENWEPKTILWLNCKFGHKAQLENQQISVIFIKFPHHSIAQFQITHCWSFYYFAFQSIGRKNGSR